MRSSTYSRTLRLLVASVACFLGCVVAVLVGFPTCDTERRGCPTWHEWVNTIAFYGAGVFLVTSVVLFLMVATDALLRRRPR
jgi:hypothetical protein